VTTCIRYTRSTSRRRLAPSELNTFTSIADEAGYHVATDLEKGKIELRGEAESYTDE